MAYKKTVGFRTYKGGSIAITSDYESKVGKIGDVRISSTHKSIKGYFIKLPLSKNEAIDCLQNIRHTLKTEINAYKDTDNFTNRHPFQNIFMSYGTAEFQLFYNYPKKLKIANEMLA